MGRDSKRNKNKKKTEKLEIGTSVMISVLVFFIVTVILLFLHSAEIELISWVEYLTILTGVVSIIGRLLGVRIPKLNRIAIKSCIGQIRFCTVVVAVIFACVTAKFLYYHGTYLELHHEKPTEPPQENLAPEPPGIGVVNGLTQEPIIDVPKELSEAQYQDNPSNPNVEILEPQTVISNAEVLTSENALILQEGPEHLLDIIDPVLKLILSPPIAKNKGEWEPRLSDTIKETVNTDSQPSSNEINGNKAFGDWTRRANQLESEITGLDAEKLFEIIDCREQAFKVFETKDLRLLLFNDYHKVARYYRLNTDWMKAYEYYIKSIEYRTRHIRALSKMDSEYFNDLYEMAILYHCIGDMPTITDEYRTEAYFLSTCLMEVVSKNTSDEGTSELGFFSSYYAGMINHKQALLGLRSHADGTDIFINDGYRYYEKSLDFEGYKKQRNYQYQYLADLCQCALNHYQWRWSAVLEPIEFYKQKKAEYLEKAV